MGDERVEAGVSAGLAWRVGGERRPQVHDVAPRASSTSAASSGRSHADHSGFTAIIAGGADASSASTESDRGGTGGEDAAVWLHFRPVSADGSASPPLPSAAA